MHSSLLLHICDRLMVFVVGKISYVLDVCNITISCILGDSFFLIYIILLLIKKKMWTRSCCEHITIPRSCSYFPGSSYMVFGGLCAPFNLNIDDQKLIY